MNTHYDEAFATRLCPNYMSENVFGLSKTHTWINRLMDKPTDACCSGLMISHLLSSLLLRNMFSRSNLYLITAQSPDGCRIWCTSVTPVVVMARPHSKLMSHFRAFLITRNTRPQEFSAHFIPHVIIFCLFIMVCGVASEPHFHWNVALYVCWSARLSVWVCTWVHLSHSHL